MADDPTDVNPLEYARPALDYRQPPVREVFTAVGLMLAWPGVIAACWVAHFGCISIALCVTWPFAGLFLTTQALVTWRQTRHGLAIVAIFAGVVSVLVPFGLLVWTVQEMGNW